MNTEAATDTGTNIAERGVTHPWPTGLEHRKPSSKVTHNQGHSLGVTHKQGHNHQGHNHVTHPWPTGLEHRKPSSKVIHNQGHSLGVTHKQGHNHVTHPWPIALVHRKPSTKKQKVPSLHMQKERIDLLRGGGEGEHAMAGTGSTAISQNPPKNIQQMIPSRHMQTCLSSPRLIPKPPSKGHPLDSCKHA
eukprot:1160188-Pelagomonas_calceolata.AAC.4